MDILSNKTHLMQNLNISEYQLITFISKRIKELMFGAKPLIEAKGKNWTTIALQELMSGAIKPKNIG